MEPRFPWRFLTLALITAWLFDQLFWLKVPGISFPIWVLICLIALWSLAWGEKIKPAVMTYLLAGLSLLTAMVVFLRGDGFTRVLAALITLGALSLLIATFRSGRWFFYRVSDYFIAAFWGMVAAFVRPLSLIRALLATGGDRKSSTDNRHTLIRKSMPFIRGLLLAIPVLLVLSGLLASADMIFRQRMFDLFKIFDLGRFPEYLFRFIYIVFFSYVFCGLFLHAILPSRSDSGVDQPKSWIKPFLGMIESGIVLSLVDILFLLFVFIQVRYLFGGEANISETGFTYSEYARRGFGELVAVAILSLLLYLALGRITKQEKRIERVIFAALSTLLILLVLVLLASAFQRLFLYENAYGFTRLRTYTHVFILWMAVLLLSVIGLEAFQRRRFFMTAWLLSVFGFILTLGVVNVDGFIAARNLLGRQENGIVDIDYLRGLSADAVPAMIKGYLSAELSESEKEALGAELACRTTMAENARNERPWQSYNLAEDRGLRWLRAYQELWQGQYRVEQIDLSWYVTSGNQTVPCRPVWLDDID